MAYKRIYIGVAITTIIGLFAYLASLGLVITSDGDKDCNFIYNNVAYCASYINVTNPKAFSVDIYNRESVSLDFVPGIKNYYLFTKDGRCSGKQGSACCTYDNICIKGWRYTNFTDATKPRDDRVYVFRYAAYSTTQHLLLGEKNKLYEKVKWTLGVGGGNLDPVWNGINIEHKLISTYSSLTEYRLKFTMQIDKTTSLVGNSKPKTDYSVINGKTPTEYRMFLIENKSTEEPVYSTEDYSCDVTEKNSTIVKNICKRYIQTGTRTIYNEKKTEYIGTSLDAGRDYVFEVVVNKRPELGQINIDVIPEILEYKFPYAWWNTSFNRCKDIFIQEDYKNRTDFPLEINLTGLTLSSANEIRIVNASCNDDGGVEVPFDVLSSGTTFASVVFFVNSTLNSNVTYSVYYDASGMSAPTYSTDLSTSNGSYIFLNNSIIGMKIEDIYGLIRVLSYGGSNWVGQGTTRGLFYVYNYTTPYVVFGQTATWNPDDCELGFSGNIKKVVTCRNLQNGSFRMNYTLYAHANYVNLYVDVTSSNYTAIVQSLTPEGSIGSSFSWDAGSEDIPYSWSLRFMNEKWVSVYKTSSPAAYSYLLWNGTNTRYNNGSAGININSSYLIDSTGTDSAYIYPSAYGASLITGDTRVFYQPSEFIFGFMASTNASDYYKWFFVHPLKTYIGTEESQVQVCQTINAAGYYQLLGNTVASQNYCINISTSNVIFDCNNYMIDGNKQTYGYLIYARNYSAMISNITVRNCKLNATTDSAAVTFYNVTNGTVKDINVTNGYDNVYVSYSSNITIVNVSGLSNSGYGIYLYYSGKCNVSKIDIRYSGTDYPLYLFESYNNTISDVTIWQTRREGIYIQSSDDNNVTSAYIRSTEQRSLYLYDTNRTVINGVTIFNCSFKVSYPCVSIVDSYNVLAANMNITSGNYDGISVSSSADISKDINFQNITIANISATRYDVIASGTVQNITFVNSSYNYLKESIAVPINLTKSFFYKAYVADLSGNAKNAANVTVTNNTGKAVYSVLTGADGWTAQTVLTDYYIRSGIRIMSSNYTATSTNTSHTATDVFNSTIIGTSRHSMLILSKISTINCTIKLNGNAINKFYEVGTMVNITINTTNSSVPACIYINVPGFVEQCSTGNLSYNWTSYIFEWRLKDGESESNKTIGSDTWTYRLYSKDDFNQFTFWLTGYNLTNYPRNTKVDVADNEDIDYIVYGDLIGNNAYIDKFKDETSASYSYSLITAGGFIKYIRMPRNFTLGNFSISATGSSTDKHEVNFSKILYASTGYSFAAEHGIKAMKLLNNSLYLMVSECTSASTNPKCNVLVKKYNILTNTIEWSTEIATDWTNGDYYDYALAVNNRFVYASVPVNFSFHQIFEVNGSIKFSSHSISYAKMWWANADEDYFIKSGGEAISIWHAENMSNICSYSESGTWPLVFATTLANSSDNYVYAVTTNGTLVPPVLVSNNVVKVWKNNCSMVWKTSNNSGIYFWNTNGSTIQVDANKIYATGSDAYTKTNWILWKNNGTTIMVTNNGLDIRPNSMTMDNDNLYTTYPNQSWYSIARLSKVNMSIMELNYTGISAKQAGVVIQNNSMFYVAEAYWANSSNSVRIWSMEKNTPTNVKIDIGNDGVNDYNKTGKLSAVGMARNLTAVQAYAANHCSGITCDVPIRFLSESAGKFTITANVTYSPNPITINISVINKHLANSIEYNTTILTDSSAMTIKSVETNGTFIWTRDYQVNGNISEFWMNGSMKREMKFSRGNSTYGCIMANGTHFLILGTDDAGNAAPYTIYIYNLTMGYTGVNLTSGLSYIPTGGCEMTSNYIYIMTSDEYVRKYHAANGSYIGRISATGSGVFSDDTYIWTIDPLIDSPDCKQYYIYKYWANGTLIDKLIIRGGGETFYQFVDGVVQGNIVYLGTGQKVYSYSINNDFGNMSVNMSSDGSGAIMMNTIRINYSGSQNITVFGYEQGGSMFNTSQIAKLIYSKFTVAQPYTWTSDIMWFPSTNSSQNVTPWSQTDNIPIFNITSQAYDQPFNISVKLNTTINSCVNLTMSSTGNKTSGKFINITEQIFLTNISISGSSGLWLWADLSNCTSRWVQPTFLINSYCQKCVRPF